MDGRRHIALRGLLHGADAAVEVGDALGDHIGQILLVEVVGGVDSLVQLRQASKSAVCKINIDSDSRLAFTAGVRETFALHPEYFDPRQYCGKAREYMVELYKHKITDVLGSDHKLANCD